MACCALASAPQAIYSVVCRIRHHCETKYLSSVYLSSKPFRRRMPLQLEHVETQQEIFDMILDQDGKEVAGFIRADSTKDPDRQRSRHEDEGFGGTMFCARTENMRKAENRLLAARGFCHNPHTQRKAAEEPGYIYVIKGKKFG